MNQEEIQNPYFTENSFGRLKFTEEGFSELRPYFAKAGINISNIKTKAEYYEARRASSHLFMDHLKQLALEGSKNTLEDQALISIFSRDEQETRKLFSKLDKRNKLGLKVI